MTYNIICFLSKFLMTDDITSLARKNKFMTKLFLGTFPADINPYEKQKTCCWIWNIDESSKGGKHWVSIWINDNNLIFFDSFGFNIEKYKRYNWIEFAKENNFKIKYFTKKPLQNILTKTCGMWSLLFLYEQIQKQKIFKRFVFADQNSFQKKDLETTLRNEKKLFLLANSIFKHEMRKIYVKKCRRSKGKQICKNFISLFDRK